MLLKLYLFPLLCYIFYCLPRSSLLFEKLYDKDGRYATQGFFYNYVFKITAKKLFNANCYVNFSHKTDVTVEGDFRLCFNNRMSTWSDKTVWFEVKCLGYPLVLI